VIVRQYICIWTSFSCLALAFCGGRDLVGDASTDDVVDTAEVPDVTEEDACTIEYRGRVYQQSDFYLCGELVGCHPEPDPLCSSLIPCPGSSCEPGLSLSCDYCTFATGIPSGEFAYAVCERGSWTIGFTHCEPSGECIDDAGCDDGDPCTVDSCVSMWCEHEAVDGDEDGYMASMVDGVVCDGDDCDDSDPEVHPGALDVCGDGIDQDCDDHDATEGVRGEVIELLDYIHTGPNLYILLVWTGSEYVFVYRTWSGPGIFLRRIDPAGKRVSADMRIREYEDAYDMAWSGSVIGTVWNEAMGDGGDAYFQAIGPDGLPLSDEIRLTDSGTVTWDGSTSYGPRIHPVGDEFAVIWLDQVGDEYQIFYTRVDGSGVKLVADAQVTDVALGVMSEMCMAWTGSEVGLVWRRNWDPRGPYLEPRLLLSRLTPSGSGAGPETTLHADASNTRDYSIVWAGSEFGLVWKEQRYLVDSGHGVLMSRLGPTGDARSTSELASYPSTSASDPTPVWTGSSFGVLHAHHLSDHGDIVLQRADSSGVLFGSPITIVGEGQPARLNLVWTGHEYGACWSEQISGTETRIKVKFARLGFCE
jgi:hypothetical protein